MSSSGEQPSLDFIIKLGGAAITDKNTLCVVNEESLKSICGVFNTVYSKCERRPRFIIVHGAGSFGHQFAKKYSIQLGTTLVQSNLEDRLNELRTGVTLVRGQLNTLTAMIVSLFGNAGLQCVATPAFPSWTTETLPTGEQRVATSNLNDIIRVLDAGYIPVLHGDCVFDQAQDSAILSGDLIVSHLAEKLRPKAVIFASDVAGVFTAPPVDANGKVNPDAVLINRILVNSDGSFEIPQTSALDHDVTGGMLGKLQCGRDIALHGISVFLTRAGSPEMQQICLEAVNQSTAEVSAPQDWHGTIMTNKS